MTLKQEKKTLEQFIMDFEHDVKPGQDVKDRRMVLEELSELLLKDNEPTGKPGKDIMSITAWTNYKNCLKLRIIPRLGYLKIYSIIPKNPKGCSKALRQDGARIDGKPGGLSESTIARDCAIVSSLLSYTIGERLLTINPLIYTGEQNKGHRSKKEYRVRCLTIGQTQASLWALDNPMTIEYEGRKRKNESGEVYLIKRYQTSWKLSLKWWAYLCLALFIGDRRGENIAFTWDDIDLNTGTVNIENPTTYVDGKIMQKKTKTNKSHTPVMPPVVTDILKLWKAEQIRQNMKRGTYWQEYHGKESDRNFIFAQENGIQIRPSSPYHQFKRIIELYNKYVAESCSHMIPPGITPHDLRHTATSILIANNMDPRSVAGILGHSSAATTLNICAYFSRSKNEEAINIVENVLIEAN